MQDIEMKGPIQSVSRAAAILRCFYERQELGLAEISDMTGLHKSTASTLVTTLKNENLLEQDPFTSKYRLGMSSFLLGANTKINLRTITQPYLVSLKERFHETVNLATADGADIIYINKLESEYSMRICTRIGQRLPFYCTANGKVLFAHHSSERLQSLMKSLPMTKFTEHTITDPFAIMQEMARARINGYAFDKEEFELGLCCCAAPIFDSTGTPVAAISLSGPAVRMTGASDNGMIEQLMKSTGEISNMLSKSSYIMPRTSFD